VDGGDEEMVGEVAPQNVRLEFNDDGAEAMRLLQRRRQQEQGRVVQKQEIKLENIDAGANDGDFELGNIDFSQGEKVEVKLSDNDDEIDGDGEVLWDANGQPVRMDAKVQFTDDGAEKNRPMKVQSNQTTSNQSVGDQAVDDQIFGDQTFGVQIPNEINFTENPKIDHIKNAKSQFDEESDEDTNIQLVVTLEQPIPTVAYTPAFVPFNVPPPTEITPVRVTREISQLATRMVDQILINDAALNNNQEIHLHLKDSVLAGAEVQIARDGGALRVTFLTPNTQMADLVHQQQGTLRETLTDRLRLDSVDIQTQPQDSGTDGGARGDGQGRSRQQRDAQEEYERNEELENQ
jgi:type III secretion system needle length determinant